ncbi:microtubule-associated protein Jupiter-like [Limulus polyphemus]|uniref:Microtubule-associated protein Jupiter-like n=1 Tax=Limulus polyphemus TaxID=6850 RepID=A0ABM1S8Q9_LIMPO|nr:microtubule-associated protein Jupiter-like [Limulus polyphemus]
MSSIREFYHVEIDKVGHGKKRITNSPGGPSSDIFGNINDQDEQKPQKRKNHFMYSSFYGAKDDSSNNQAIQRRASWHTQSNVFGNDLTGITTPRKVVDRMKSNVFDGPQPVTKSCSANKYKSPNTIISNGDPVSPAQFSVRVRIPPGGKSSGIF